MVKVIKADGTKETFSKEKLNQSMIRAGVGKTIREKVIAEVKDKLYEGISTKEIYDLVSEELDRQEKYLASKYSLKKAIMRLGPTGYPFEKFVAGLLQRKGYKTETAQELMGKCVSHEVDVIAQKDNKKFAVECKYHNKRGTKTDIQNALYIYARYLDLKEAQQLDEMWLVTNTKMTSKAVEYSECVGLKVLSWDYSGEWSWSELVENSDLYPITCLETLTRPEEKELLNEGIVFCRDLRQSPKSKYLLPENKKEDILKEIEFLTG